MATPAAPSNPKAIRAQKEGKAAFEYLPFGPLRGAAGVMQHGGEKYGRYNWREDKILLSTYKAAIMRHLIAFFEDQENLDPDSGESHLSHILACCLVCLDAINHGSAVDDRGLTESKEQ